MILNAPPNQKCLIWHEKKPLNKSSSFLKNSESCSLKTSPLSPVSPLSPPPSSSSSASCVFIHVVKYLVLLLEGPPPLLLLLLHQRDIYRECKIEGVFVVSRETCRKDVLRGEVFFRVSPRVFSQKTLPDRRGEAERKTKRERGRSFNLRFLFNEMKRRSCFWVCASLVVLNPPRDALSSHDGP